MYKLILSVVQIRLPIQSAIHARIVQSVQCMISLFRISFQEKWVDLYPIYVIGSTDILTWKDLQLWVPGLDPYLTMYIKN